jgi:hypothetical protein
LAVVATPATGSAVEALRPYSVGESAHLLSVVEEQVGHRLVALAVGELVLGRPRHSVGKLPGREPGFDSRQLPQRGGISGSRRGPLTCWRWFQEVQASLRYIRSWRCQCGDNPSRTCAAAKVCARAAKRPVPRRTPTFSGRTSAHLAKAPSAFSPRRLPRRIAPVINPQKNPRKKHPRARRVFLRTTADAMNPHVAATMATVRSREIRCVGPSNPISQPPGRCLPRPLCRSNHRLRRTSIAGQSS